MQSIPEKLLSIRWLKEWHQPDLLEFIRTGNAALLARVPQTPAQHAWALHDVIPTPSNWTSEADNLLKLVVRDGMKGAVTNWLDRFCRYKSADWEQFHPALRILRGAGVDESWIESSLKESNFFDVSNLKITPAGNVILQYDDSKLLGLLGRNVELFAAAVAASDPERLERLMKSEWKLWVAHLRWDVIVSVHPGFHTIARQHYVRNQSENRLLKSLSDVRPDLYRDWAVSELRHNLNDSANTQRQGWAILGLLEILGAEALPELIRWGQFVQFEAPSDAVRNREWILNIRLKEFPFANPCAFAEAMSRSDVPEVSLAGLKACEKQGG